MTNPVILTGLRANNDLHIGNYLGALLPIIEMARKHGDDHQINLFIPDLHSFTTPVDHAQLQAGIMSALRVFVAAGLPLDNDNVHIYRQSYISAHSELTWILNCFTGVGEMGRMIEYKDKSARLGDDRVSVGLFNYPVLMAADILLYDAKYVPVGDDQRQHLEYTRDIAVRMNNQFGDLFTVPEPVADQHKFFGKDQGLRIRDLVEPNRKMSKSDASGKGVIFLTDTPADAKAKIMSATTDSVGVINRDYEQQPGVSNLLDILEHLGGQSQEFIGQAQYGPLKTAVAQQVEIFLNEFQNKLANVDSSTLEQKLEASEERMRQHASQTLSRVQRAIGLR